LKTTHSLAAIAAYVIWGFLSIPLKLLSSYPSGLILYFRVAAATLLLALVAGLFRRKASVRVWHEWRTLPTRERRRLLWVNVLCGLFLATNWLIFIYVINHINIQTGSFAYLICPILTALLGNRLLGEHLRQNQWVSIVLGGLSCVILATGALTNLLFSLLIAASYAFYLIIQRQSTVKDKMVLLTLQLTVAFVVLAPFYALFSGGTAVAAIGYDFWLLVILISAFFTVLPLFLSLFALQSLTSGTMGILMYINPIVNFLVAFIYFREQSSWQQLVAYAMIGVAVLLYNLPERRVRQYA
jgi:chloramphenicol-sensitive protein RarD